MMRIFLLTVALIGLNGCVAKPKTYPSIAYLKLELPTSESLNIKPFELSIGVSLPTGSAARSDKLIYQDTKGMRHNYAYHRWENFLGEQLQEHFVLFFAKANIVKDIARADNQINPDWILETHILDFVQIMQDENSAYIRVLGRMRLADSRTHEGISQKLFSYEIPLSGLGPKALNEAYDKVLKIWTKDSLDWLIKTGETYAR
ncbi:MAG: hypothetical protein GX780_03760 [Campylobacteraceae bacterium]|nr:hypothetical protein [Campylobacteraceae bacterium]